MIKLPYEVVGHRGFPQYYPENSLIGLVAAAEVGAHAVELDVQVSADGVPMVFHDEDLQRVCGIAGDIWQYTAEQLSKISCHEEDRLGNKFFPSYIATLAQVCEALKDYDCHVFVELKEKSIEQVGRKAMLAAVIEACKAIAGNYSIISFDYEILEMAKLDVPIGWALREVNSKSLEKAQKLSPQVLIADVKKIDLNEELWPGPWRWFLYDIIDPEEALEWARRGVSYIETWDAQSLLSSNIE